tara:strand:+ start:2903 stop:4474 length:1572 start_codon:yes stop_codon:yes gene_type:complete
MNPLRTCLILDSLDLKQWQFDALDEVIQKKQVQIDLILLCNNNQTKKKWFRYAIYYFIRLFLMRPKSWRKVSQKLWSDQVTILEFDAELQNGWQRIPLALLDKVRTYQIDLTIKWGMGLLSGASDFPSRLGILSYHHGDPQKYRGRPSAFYELLNNASSVGAVVQEINDELDAGKIWAYGKFKVFHHSYRDTLESLYSGSSYLLSKAIKKRIEGIPLSLNPEGENYRLPKNNISFYFLFKIFHRKIKRIIYGAFYQKEWKVGIQKKDFFESNIVSVDEEIPCPQGYSFIADCFFYKENQNQIICEGLNKKTGKGNLLIIDRERARRVDLFGSSVHLSYPFSWEENGKTFLLPEAASAGAPCMYVAEDLWEKLRLVGLENQRLIDPTLIHWEGYYWIFASIPKKIDHLYLWFSEKKEGPYFSHPMNPVVQNPDGARPGGRIIKRNGKLYRPGQKNCFSYGEGISWFEIKKLNSEFYLEEKVGETQVKGFKGPHTIDFCDDKVLFDYYEDRFYYLAFLERIKNRL